MALTRRAGLGSNPRTPPRPQAPYRDPIWGPDPWVENRWASLSQPEPAGDAGERASSLVVAALPRQRSNTLNLIQVLSRVVTVGSAGSGALHRLRR